MTQPRLIDCIGITDWGTHPCPPEHLRELLDDREELTCSFEVCETDDIGAYDGIITLYHHDEFLDAAEWAHNVRSGYEDFPLDAYREAGVTMTNSTGIAGDLVAEIVTGLVVTLAKGLHRCRDRQRDREWERLPWRFPSEVSGSNACVVGLGELGGSVVSRLGILGIDVAIVHDGHRDAVETCNPLLAVVSALLLPDFVEFVEQFLLGRDGLVGHRR